MRKTAEVATYRKRGAAYVGYGVLEMSKNLITRDGMYLCT
jgi:hypothetical protein